MMFWWRKSLNLLVISNQIGGGVLARFASNLIELGTKTPGKFMMLTTPKPLLESYQFSDWFFGRFCFEFRPSTRRIEGVFTAPLGRQFKAMFLIAF